jgi:membrane fusion protein (multidrug efflux system)
MTSKKTEQTEKARNPKRLIIVGVAVAIVLTIGIIYWVIGSHYESTDNAQLDANIVPVRASVAGYIKTIRFKDNEHVKKGQLLISIDETDLQTRVAQAQAELENARANLLAAKNNALAINQNAESATLSSNSVEQNINSANAKLQRAKEDFRRSENMFNAKASTQSQHDAAKSDLDVAQAQYDGAIAMYKSSSAQANGVHSQAEAQQAQITLSEALVKQREAELKLAQTQLQYASVIAPCNGIVSKRAVEEGQYITIGAPLCSLIDKEIFWVTANFKETQVDRIAPGQEVEIKLDAYPALVLKGKIESFIGATGAKFSLLPPDNSTGNFVKVTQRVPVRIEVTSFPKDKSYLLFPGLSAFVEVKVN